MKSSSAFSYKWYSLGDISASTVLIFDNLTLLTFIVVILDLGYKFPMDVIMHYIVPGTVVGGIVGNLLCFLLAFRVAKKQNQNITAMPLGLDAPSAIGYVVCIIGPAFSLLVQHGANLHQAAIHAWQLGVGCLFVNGVIKLIASSFIKQLRALIPSAALLGAIGGVAIGLIGYFALTSMFATPIVGLLSFAIVFLTMFARIKLPFNLSSIPIAIIVGTAVYYILLPLGLSGSLSNIQSQVGFLLPYPNMNFIKILPEVINYIPVVIPFALLVIFGTMSVEESAAILGVRYGVRNLAIIDSIATIISSFFGGIVQTTPYAGFPAYRNINARAGYLLINIVVVGIGGVFGIVGLIVGFVPESAVAPVLLYVAFEIGMQGFNQSDKKYVAPILFSFFPCIARLIQIKLTSGDLIPVAKLQDQMFTNVYPHINDYLIATILGNGFIVTGVLWASFLCFAIDKRWISSFVCAVILSILSYFGIIHSLLLSGAMVLPSQLPATVRMVPLELSIGYLLLGICVLIAGKLRHNDSPSH